MTEKQFEIIGEKYIGHMQGNAFVISNTDGYSIFIKEAGKEKTKDSWLLQKEIDELSNENRHLKIDNEILEENEEEFFELKKKYGELEKENEELRQFINKGRRLSVKEVMNSINENGLLKKKIKELEKENKELKKARDESDKFIVKKGLEIEFLEWCMK